MLAFREPYALSCQPDKRATRLLRARRLARSKPQHSARHQGERPMKKALVLGALLLTPMLLTAQQAPAGGATPAATGRGGGGGRGGGTPAPQPPAELVSRGGGTCANFNAQTQQWVVEQKWNCINEPNPLPPINSVWLEEMTWMDVRDALAAGKTTVIIATGGFEPNGPFLALGKHNYVLQAN